MADDDFYNTPIKQGKRFQLDFTWHDDATPAVNYDVSGYTALLHLRTSEDSETIIHTSTDADDITLGAAEDWHIQWVLDTATTAAFTFSRALADLELINPSGEVEESVRIEFNLIKEVTR